MRAATPVIEAPLGRLEQVFIDEFLRSQGIDPAGVADLPENQKHTLLRQASVYASARLSELEARSHFVHEIQEVHHGVPRVTKTSLQ